MKQQGMVHQTVELAFHIPQTSNCQVLHTLISSASLIWSDDPEHQRTMTKDEVLVGQCVPVAGFDGFTSGYPCSSFAAPRAEEATRAGCFHMAGNSMHTECSGMFLLFAATQIQRSEVSQSLSRAARNLRLQESASHP
jgi:hypothetical protein